MPSRDKIGLAMLLALLSAPGSAQVRVSPKSQVRVSPKSSPCSALCREITALTAETPVARAHWGVVVIGLDGSPIVTLNAAQLFQPASNAKLFTIAAAMALLSPDRTSMTRVVAHQTPETQSAPPHPADRTSVAHSLHGDLYLIGAADANLSGRTLPYTPPAHAQTTSVPLVAPAPEAPRPVRDPLRSLADLADQVAATGLTSVSGDVVGDDTLFPYDPYPIDWSIDDTVWGYGAPVSALTVNDNELPLTISPGKSVGAPAIVSLNSGIASTFYTINAQVSTGPPKSPTSVQVDRGIGSRVLRVYGRIAVDAAPDIEEVAIDDPAEFAAIAFKHLLEQRGIDVRGVARPKHLLPSDPRSFLEQTAEPLTLNEKPDESVACGSPGGPAIMPDEHVLAAHRSPTLAEDVVITDKLSLNLHAELLLRTLGEVWTCHGTGAGGARVLRSFLLNRVGLGKDDFVFYDGSGLSGHDLVTPRAIARLLQYARSQPWFAVWKQSLPIGGVDGSLTGRFREPPLRGRVFAKTGTLGEARALSGYLVCASGRTVIFSILVGNHTPGSIADREVIDRIVAAIAKAN